MQGRGYYDSPVGALLIESEDERITLVNFVRSDERNEEHLTPAIERCITELVD